MSAIASFYVVQRGDLSALAAAAAAGARAGVRRVLDTTGRELDDVYLWSGYAFTFLMAFLAERGVYGQSEFAAVEEELNAEAELEAYILTPGAFSDLGQLDPDVYDEAEIITYFDELGMGFPEAGIAGKEAITVLGTQMRVLSSDQALLVLVG